MGLLITTPYYAPSVGGGVDWASWDGSLDGTLTATPGLNPGLFSQSSSVKLNDTTMLSVGYDASGIPAVQVTSISGNTITNESVTAVDVFPVAGPARAAITPVDSSTFLIMYDINDTSTPVNKISLCTIIGSVITIEDTVTFGSPSLVFGGSISMLTSTSALLTYATNPGLILVARTLTVSGTTLTLNTEYTFPGIPLTTTLRFNPMTVALTSNSAVGLIRSNTGQFSAIGYDIAGTVVTIGTETEIVTNAGLQDDRTQLRKIDSTRAIVAVNTDPALTSGVAAVIVEKAGTTINVGSLYDYGGGISDLQFPSIVAVNNSEAVAGALDSVTPRNTYAVLSFTGTTISSQGSFVDVTGVGDGVIPFMNAYELTSDKVVVFGLNAGVVQGKVLVAPTT